MSDVKITKRRARAKSDSSSRRKKRLAKQPIKKKESKNRDIKRKSITEFPADVKLSNNGSAFEPSTKEEGSKRSRSKRSISADTDKEIGEPEVVELSKKSQRRNDIEVPLVIIRKKQNYTVPML